MNKNIVIVGAQWGDEAKGKVVDMLAGRMRMVVRYGGGANAGHTVTANGDTWKFHLMPAGILHSHVDCIIAAGVVIDPLVLSREIADLRDRGVSLDRLFISDEAHVVMPYHLRLDALEELNRGSGKLGTTGRGIGPAYRDKYARLGVRMADLIRTDRFLVATEAALKVKNAELASQDPDARISAADIVTEYAEAARELAPHVCDTSVLVSRAVAGGGVLFEGAQGTLLDIDSGTYPYVTSSHTVAGGACIGTGAGPTSIHSVVGVSKVYATRVGEGAFPTILEDATGDAIRARGNEYGTTTGRPRKCGWLDVPVLRYAVRINGLASLALGHLDVFSGLGPVKLCTSYVLPDGTVTECASSSILQADGIRPVYEELPGWDEPVTEVRRFSELPLSARKLVHRISELTGVPVATVSVGPSRDQTITLSDPLA
ncbi:MAG: adenylosuccinate synthase [Armatimonadetes bacterium]|nr:adenylosuccinate synthase [Armatimonadota bacterium]MDE2206789.1 adenylosuccinate synthase [Armatimonadota bacterium]